MKGIALLTLLVAAAGCKGDCPPSADIQVTITPLGIDPAKIASLHIGLTVNDGTTKYLDVAPLPHPLDGPSSFVLHPESPPAAEYTVAVTVQALASDKTVLATGATSSTVSAHGCNRIDLQMGMIASDGGTDDLAGCNMSDLDEDGDGMSDSCDRCPADYDPNDVDTDKDGLPDACDPDPMTAGDLPIFFDGFNLASDTHWSGGFTVSGGFMDINAMDGQSHRIPNGADMLPLNVRVQASVFVTQYVSGGTLPDVGLYLVSSPNIDGNATHGVRCTIQNNGQTNDDSLVVLELSGGVATTNTQSKTIFPLTGQRWRLRLTQRGSEYTCEAEQTAAAATGQPDKPMGQPTSVVLTAQTAPGAPQFVALRATADEAHIHSVVAESLSP